MSYCVHFGKKEIFVCNDVLVFPNVVTLNAHRKDMLVTRSGVTHLFLETVGAAFAMTVSRYCSSCLSNQGLPRFRIG